MTDYTEAEIRPEVLAALTRRPGMAIDDIIQEVATGMDPDGVDASSYRTRPDGEPRFNCKVRNVLRTCRPLIANGLVSYTGEEGDRRYFPTDEGRRQATLQQRPRNR
ncbi:MAG: hypothetical protein KBI47_10665 [Armatimonadetes bacterium]|nr:hypothetical protein [Armatimonadota bacterium]